MSLMAWRDSTAKALPLPHLAEAQAASVPWETLLALIVIPQWGAGSTGHPAWQCQRSPHRTAGCLPLLSPSSKSVLAGCASCRLGVTCPASLL